jgi:HSP20 family molecular chaperone IbpA
MQEGMTNCQISYSGIDVVLNKLNNNTLMEKHMITTTSFIFDDIFNSIFDTKPTSYKPTFNTNLELEKDTDLFIKVPGCSRNDVQVEVDDRYIVVNAKANVEGFDFQLERKYIIPSNVDRDSITAVVENGLLVIGLKKKVDKMKVKKLL